MEAFTLAKSVEALQREISTFLGDPEALQPERYTVLLEHLLSPPSHFVYTASVSSSPPSSLRLAEAAEGERTVLPAPSRVEAASPPCRKQAKEASEQLETADYVQGLGMGADRSLLLCLRVAHVTALYRWLLQDDVFLTQLRPFVEAVTEYKQRVLLLEEQRARSRGGSPSNVHRESLAAWQQIVAQAFRLSPSSLPLSSGTTLPSVVSGSSGKSRTTPRSYSVQYSLQLFAHRLEVLSALPRELYRVYLNSEAHQAYHQSHAALAAWERRNAILLRHPDFMERRLSFKPSLLPRLTSSNFNDAVENCRAHRERESGEPVSKAEETNIGDNGLLSLLAASEAKEMPTIKSVLGPLRRARQGRTLELYQAFAELEGEREQKKSHSSMVEEEAGRSRIESSVSGEGSAETNDITPSTLVRATTTPDMVAQRLEEFKQLEERLISSFQCLEEADERSLVRRFHEVLAQWAVASRLQQLEEWYHQLEMQRRRRLLSSRKPLPSLSPSTSPSPSPQNTSYGRGPQPSGNGLLSHKAVTTPGESQQQQPAPATAGSDIRGVGGGGLRPPLASPSFSLTTTSPSPLLSAAYRVAQLSLPFLLQTAHENWVRTAFADDGSVARKKRGETSLSTSSIQQRAQVLRWLNHPIIFQYWMLTCLTADHPEKGPNLLCSLASAPPTAVVDGAQEANDSPGIVLSVCTSSGRVEDREMVTEHHGPSRSVPPPSETNGGVAVSSPLGSRSASGADFAPPTSVKRPQLYPLSRCLKALWVQKLKPLHQQTLLERKGEELKIEQKPVGEEADSTKQIRGAAGPSVSPRLLFPTRSRAAVATAASLATVNVDPSFREAFSTEVAEVLGFPSILLLVDVHFHYHEPGATHAVHEGKLDAVLYDETNERVLLVIVPPHTEAGGGGGALRGVAGSPTPSFFSSMTSSSGISAAMHQDTPSSASQSRATISDYLNAKLDMWKLVSVLRAALEMEGWEAAAEEVALTSGKKVKNSPHKRHPPLSFANAVEVNDAEAVDHALPSFSRQQTHEFFCDGVVAEFLFDPPSPVKDESSDGDNDENEVVAERDGLLHSEVDRTHLFVPRSVTSFQQGGSSVCDNGDEEEEEFSGVDVEDIPLEEEESAEAFLRGQEEQFYCVMAPTWLLAAPAPGASTASPFTNTRRVSIPLRAWKDAVQVPPQFFKVLQSAGGDSLSSLMSATASGMSPLPLGPRAAAVSCGRATSLLVSPPSIRMTPWGQLGDTASFTQRNTSLGAPGFLAGAVSAFPPPPPPSPSLSSLGSPNTTTTWFRPSSAMSAIRQRLIEAMQAREATAAEEGEGDAAAVTSFAQPAGLSTTVRHSSYATPSQTISHSLMHHALTLFRKTVMVDAVTQPEPQEQMSLMSLVDALLKDLDGGGNDKRPASTHADDVDSEGESNAWNDAALATLLNARKGLESIRTHCLEALFVRLPNADDDEDEQRSDGEHPSSGLPGSDSRSGAPHRDTAAAWKELEEPAFFSLRRHRLLVQDGLPQEWLYRIGDPTAASDPSMISGGRRSGESAKVAAERRPSITMGDSTAAASAGSGVVRRTGLAVSSGNGMQTPLQVLADLLRREGGDHPLLEVARQRKRWTGPPADSSAAAVRRRRAAAERRCQLRQQRAKLQEKADKDVYLGRAASRTETPHLSVRTRSTLHSFVAGVEPEEEEMTTVWF